MSAHGKLDEVRGNPRFEAFAESSQ